MPRVGCGFFIEAINSMRRILSFKVTIGCAESTARGSKLAFELVFSGKKCLGARKMHINRQNYAQCVSNRRPLHFPKGRGRGKGMFCSPRDPHRRLVRFPGIS